ncbi:hypothetical protein XENOCAPTIV_027118, partial [Xenoophorus captivus]
YLRNPGFQSSMSEMSHQTTLLAGVKREEVLISNNAASWRKLLIGGISHSETSHSCYSENRGLRK